MTGTARGRLEGWRSARWRSAGGAVGSDQRAIAPRPVVAASEDGARELGRIYWTAIRRASRGLLQPRERDGGIQIRLAGGPVLFVFDPPELGTADEVTCRYAVRGGLLVRRPGGALTLSQAGGGPAELRAQVAGFFPRLGAAPGRRPWTGALYGLQERAHVAISRRWLAQLMEEGPE
jgi:hypothetical protein